MTKKLEATLLRRRCDSAQFDFESTDSLPELTDMIGQPRATAALRFGVGTTHEGYNIFALGLNGSGRHTLVLRFLEERAATEPVPADWCHTFHFAEPHRPRLLRLPPGMGVELRRDMEKFTEELHSALVAAFESEEYQSRRQLIDEELKNRSEKVFAELEAEGRRRGIAVLKTPMGLAFAPIHDEEVMAPDEFHKLPDEVRQRLEEEISRLQKEFQQMLRQVPRWEKERQEALRQLHREVTGFAVEHLIDELKHKYEAQENVVAYLVSVEADVVERAQEILRSQEPNPLVAAMGQAAPSVAAGKDATLRRYQVNVLVDHSASRGAPVVYLDHPSVPNLLGRVEHMAQMGALVTDFSLIKGGALHQANGGYLILDAQKLLQQPFAWESLKRALRSKSLRIESVRDALSLVSTVTLEPEPVPLDLKVVLLGDPRLYYLLCQYDPDFSELFKVAADFEQDMERSPESEVLYARLLGKMVRRQDLLHLDPSGVARVIEESSRMVSDSQKLSTRMGEVGDLLREADYWARHRERPRVGAGEVEEAVRARIYRSDRLRERLQELTLRDTLLIETEGARVGQVNGLSVLALGNFHFGRPSRITARVRMGKGEVVDIEREVELAGPIHSKGVLILAGFLGGRFAGERPLSLAASLVFEQSYGGVDGDSASSAELYALLSAIAEIPLRQSLAVTGSVNQLGQVQAIGGANEKIEGFYDLCQARGLTGDQGVLIPAANVQNLMLRLDVVEAVDEGRFHVYAVDTVDDGIEILTGIAAGTRDAAGEFPPQTVNGRVEARLAHLTQQAREWSGSAAPGEGSP